MLRLRPLVAVAGLLAMVGPSAHADLDAYVNAPDPSFAWKLTDSKRVDEGQIHSFTLTSQTWRKVVWTHRLTVFEPNEVKYPDASLLFITGGNNRSMNGGLAPDAGFALAKLCRGHRSPPWRRSRTSPCWARRSRTT